MKRSLLHNRRLYVSTVLLCVSSGAGTLMFGQSRDFNAERLLLDDNAGDGTRNTLTLQVPVTGLAANRTLTFPDADGTVLTAGPGGLTANQIVFGGPSGQAAQSANLLWNNTTNVFSVGGSLFSVDGTSGNTVIGGTLNQQGAISNSTGDVTINDNAVVTGTSDLQGQVGSTTGDLQLADNVDVTGDLDVGAGNFTVAGATGNTDVGGTLNVDGATTLVGAVDAQAAGNVMGDGTDAEQLEVQGVVGGAVEVDIDGDVDISGALTVGSFSMSSDLDMNQNDIVDLGDIQFSTAGSNLSNTAGDVTINDNAVVTGTSDLQGQVGNTTGDLQLADNVDVTGDLDVGAGNFTVAGATGNTDVGGTLNVDGATTHVGTLDQQGGVSNSTGNVAINDDLDLTGDIVPTANATYNLGSDANRWAEAYVDGSSVHIGPTGGEAANTELALGYAANTGSVNVNGGNAEITVDASAQVVRFDPDGDGSLEAFVRDDGIGVNTGLGTDLLIAQDGIQRNGGATETFSFTNSGGALNVTVSGGLAATGSVDAQGAGNVMGDGTDAEQLEVQGVVGGAVEVDIDGDVDISGALTVGSFSMSSDLDMNQNDIVDVGNIEFSTVGSNVSNTAGDVTINDNVAVTGDLDVGAGNFTVAGATGNTDVGGTLNVDGVTTLGGGTAVTNSRLVVDDGHWTSQQTTAPAAAGAGANVTSATLSNETDVAGFIDITSSATPAAGAQATVTFNTAYNTAPIVSLTPANGPGVGVGAYVTRTTTGFTVNFIGLPAASTSHQFFYQVIETQ